MSENPVASVRHFNRFYTHRIGVLNEGHLRSPFSLAEVRVLYELAHRDAPTAVELARALGLDAGYLSRILRRFDRQGLVARTRSPDDGRQSHLRLTDAGRETFAALNGRSSDEIAAMLGALSAPEQRRLLELCRNPATVSDLASDIDLPLRVTQVLLADLCQQGLVEEVRHVPLAERPDPRLLLRVLDDLRRL